MRPSTRSCGVCDEARRPAPRQGRSAHGASARVQGKGIELSERLSCPNPDCDGTFTISDAPDAQSLCSVCNLTWDSAADTAAPVVYKAPGLEGSIDTERADWADAQVVHPALDAPNPNERQRLSEWYERFDELTDRFDSLGPEAQYNEALELLSDDPDLHNEETGACVELYKCTRPSASPMMFRSNQFHDHIPAPINNSQ